MSTHKVVLLGDGGVGKSALTIPLTQNTFVFEYDPTIENSYRKQMEIDGEVCMLDILDTAGQEEYSAMKDQYIRVGEGFVLVYSIVSRGTFEEVSKIHNRILMVKEIDPNQFIPIVVVGNKCDLENDREVPKTELEALGKRINCPVIEASAKQRLNVEEAFKQIIREIRKLKTPTPDLTRSRNRRRRGCIIL